MIKLNADYSFERDTYGWMLHHWLDGKDKDGNPKRKRSTTYHVNLHQICSTVIDRTAGNCKSMAELHALLVNAEDRLTGHAESKVA